ncbi:RHS repeat domain-containing protein [Sphingomonas koreensis]
MKISNQNHSSIWKAAVFAVLLPFPALCQDDKAKDVPVISPQPDSNGVDLAFGTYFVASPFDINVPAAARLADRATFNGRRMTHSLKVYLYDTYYTYTGGPPPGETETRSVKLHVAGEDKLFKCTGTAHCVQTSKPDGSILYRNTSTQYTYHDNIGVKYQFFLPYTYQEDLPCPDGEILCKVHGSEAFVSTITYPNGEKLTFSPFSTATNVPGGVSVVDTVSSNLGYAVSFTYTLPSYTPFSTAGFNWLNSIPGDRNSVTAMHKGGEILRTISTSNTMSGTHNSDVSIVQQDNLGRNFQLSLHANATYSHCNSVIDYTYHLPTRTVSPAGVTTDIEYIHVGGGTPYSYLSVGNVWPVKSVKRNGRTWSYTWGSSIGSQATTQDPAGGMRSVKASGRWIDQGGSVGCPPPATTAHVDSSSDQLLRQTQFAYDPVTDLQTGATLPASNGFSYQYDARGNLTKVIRSAQSGSGISQVVFEAGFDVTCVNPVTCNRPNWTKDGKGSQTDYTYDLVHGGVLTMTSPPDQVGTRPQTRYAYTPYDTGNGILYRVSGISLCAAGSSCVGTAAEARTAITYWSSTLLPETVTQGAGDGSVSTSLTYSYDDSGNPIQITDGRGNVSYRRYDGVGRLVGEIMPPSSDGTRQATRISYNGDDQVLTEDKGTVTDVTEAAWTAFSLLQRVTNSYDASGLKAKTTVSDASGIVYAVAQFSYDAVGRLECAARRMNQAAFANLPASACWLGAQGSQGPDRITRNVYDAAGQAVQLRKAVGTSLEQAYATYSYTPNGKREYVIDANGNKARMVYDGFDRRTQWQFPLTTAPGGYDFSSPAVAFATSGAVNADDREEYGYDGNDNRTSLRKRDGRSIAYAHDALNRVTSKTYPGGGARAVYYSYDLRGLQTAARFDSVSGSDAVLSAWDAIGRQTSSTTSMGGVSRTLSYQHDVNGNRTRITWPDSQYARASWDGLDRFLFSDAPAGSNLNFVSYDTAGRVGIFYRWGGTTWESSTTYGYDGISRLTSAYDTFNNSVADVTTLFSYNPASQIVSRTRNNDDYRYTSYANASRSYAVNGLNQYATVDSNPYVYDANGNLTSDGVKTYSYDIENRLTGTSTGVTLTYDPLGRLAQVAKSPNTTRFLYDGDALVAEYDGVGAMLKRYVHGPGADDDAPLVEYAGSSMASPRHLIADHQGSIIAITDSGGNRVQVNSYDEYGVPGASNDGRFQYTGQAWIPELGMYHYKARIYSPLLGRFLQTDPIGYDDQVNLYAYVGNDPVNMHDPTGESARVVVSGAKWGYRIYKYGGNLRRASRETIKEISKDWHALDTNAKTSTWEKAKASIDLLTGLNLYSVIYDTDNTGKIKDEEPGDVHVGDDELDQAIEELEISITRRKFENDREPRGNPGGGPEDRRKHETYVNHVKRIIKEQKVLEEIRKRMRGTGEY